MTIVPMVCLSVALLTGRQAPDALKSGPPVGAENDRRGFYPQWVSGPGAGERRCPV